MIRTESEWQANTGLLQTRLSGVVTEQDVIEWRGGLMREVAKIPEHSRFKLLLDLNGFAPNDVRAHKAMRSVVPELMARHGLRPAFIDLFEDQPELEIRVERGVRCVAFANVHHDEVKMSDYQARIGKPNQRFFTDHAEAEAWLQRISLDGIA